MPSWSIHLQNIAAAYGSETVLQDISLQINQGDIIAIIGPNGGGKTTFLHLILGLIKPSQGKITLKGCPRIGYLPQQLLGDRNIPVTVSEWLQVSSDTFSLFRKRPSAAPKIFNALKEFDLIPIQNRRLDTLSGGELQRVMIAASLIEKPDLLILDEPTTGVDIAKESAIENILKQQIHNHGLSLLMVSHDLHWVSRIAQKIICLNRSHCVIGDAQQMLQQHILTSIYKLDIHPPTHSCHA